MRNIVHFQEKLQHPICVNRRSDTMTLTINRSEVTCGNCIEKLKRQSRGPIDWDDIYKSVKEKVSPAQRRVKEFCFAHPEVTGEAVLENGPPQIILSFAILPKKKSRRKTVGYNFGRYDESNIVQILVPTEDESNEVATFVGQLGTELSLYPRRHPERRDSALLVYQLRPKYGK